MSHKFILDAGRLPVACDDLFAWASWMEQAHTDGLLQVALDQIGDYVVSSVFLAVDSNFGHGTRPPRLFETMVFIGTDCAVLDRYTSWPDAEAGHALVSALLRRELAQGRTPSCGALLGLLNGADQPKEDAE